MEPNPPTWNVMLATCPSRTSLAKIANKWTAMIVIALSDGPARFGEIRELVEGITGKVLTTTLRDLERDGIVTRTAYNEMPPRVEYELTPLGQTLRAPLLALGLWAEAHISEVLEARVAFDQRGSA
ncbi:transcriptional regulator [Pseudoclavibacter sp. RFBJ3]|uniref:winged helix-turn-helix transcriptional regulator n=1 Tax=unclassified Pseudoclavibacter TaxID=2615177 RepID=UPI000CE7EF5B|nr:MULTISPECIES: helix-turn-helix domain-containing protein [unclassified Pseudoclavibacter]PPF87526.1 transcriptional regulator [Pseudoclavibacter sp. RFBJ5]PPF90376.1 transcriptional regulator [Pseudoclavibacter sp. RFBJ3]PPG01061.1 transcriptional regulator [Pseudoclavibacter sp. RFBH5]PPG26164.1 transcriptional regulator [Pseudoclavibacter sp. RFBI4]